MSDSRARLMRDHPFNGSGPYCEHWSRSSKTGNAGTLTFGSQCGWPPDMHPAAESDEDWMDTAPALEAIGTPFTAALRGDCAECQCGIRPGDTIQRTEGGYAHALCLRLLMRPVV